jgi:hypothetical protein
MKPFRINIKSRKILPNISDEQMEALAKRVGLDLTTLKEIQNAAHRLYQEIGYDLAECNDGKPTNREDLVEVLLDASRLEKDSKLSETAKTWLDSMVHYDLVDIYAAVGAAFPFPKYE